MWKCWFAQKHQRSLQQNPKMAHLPLKTLVSGRNVFGATKTVDIYFEVIIH